MNKATITMSGIPLDVDYTHHPASRGYYEKGGIQISPDETAFNEVLDIRIAGTIYSIYQLFEDFDLLEHVEAELSLETEDEGNYDE